MGSNQDGAGMFVAQNRKLDILLFVVGVVGGTWLRQHGEHTLGWLVLGLVGIELLAQWGGIVGVLFLPVLGVRKAMQLTRRQRRARTVYKVGGKEWYAVPITRAVQERLAATVPDSALEAAAVPSFLTQMVTGGEGPQASDLRSQWMQNISTLYEQLHILLVDANGVSPDIEWLGDTVPVARASALITEINERAAVEDNLPA